jgi:hypothetical protein
VTQGNGEDPAAPFVAEPHHVAHIPELAILAALDATLLAASTMLAAAHGDLAVPHDPEATHARQIQELALDLRLTLAEYRRVVLDIDEQPQEDPFAD